MTTQTQARIALFVGADGDTVPAGILESESTPLAKLLSESVDTGGVELTVISLGTSRTFVSAAVHIRLEHAPMSAIDKILKALGAYALRERLDTFPVGRLLNSLGPLAPSRVFWRAMKQHPEALRLLESSDIAIATDLESTKAAWIAVHRGWVDNAYFDHRALTLMQGERSATTS